VRIWCCQCQSDVTARLTDGAECYPHRIDLASLPFWKCDACAGFVGCHHKTQSRTRPLGHIADAAMRKARARIHELIDPEWQSGRFSRRGLYARIGRALGREYHTAELRSLKEADAVYRAASLIINGN
jgi:hypothetical protein